MYSTNKLTGEKDVLFLHMGGGSQKKGNENLDGEDICSVKIAPVMEISLVIDVILEKLHPFISAYLSVKVILLLLHCMYCFDI